MQVGIVQTMGWQFYGSFVIADNHNYSGCKINKKRLRIILYYHNYTHSQTKMRIISLLAIRHTSSKKQWNMWKWETNGIHNFCILFEALPEKVV